MNIHLTTPQIISIVLIFLALIMIIVISKQPKHHSPFEGRVSAKFIDVKPDGEIEGSDKNFVDMGKGIPELTEKLLMSMITRSSLSLSPDEAAVAFGLVLYNQMLQSRLKELSEKDKENKDEKEQQQKQS